MRIDEKILEQAIRDVIPSQLERREFTHWLKYRIAGLSEVAKSEQYWIYIQSIRMMYYWKTRVGAL